MRLYIKDTKSKNESNICTRPDQLLLLVMPVNTIFLCWFENSLKIILKKQKNCFLSLEQNISNLQTKFQTSRCVKFSQS